jgi:hypothetical protein
MRTMVAKKQGRYLKDNLGKSIVNHYSIAQGDGGQELGEWSTAGILTSGQKIEGERRA